MTAIVGVLCKDGVVIASDSASTFATSSGSKTIEQPSKKCEVINGEVITCGTGAFGLTQRFQDIIRTGWDIYRKSAPTGQTKSAITICTEIARDTLINFRSTGIAQNTAPYGSVIGFLHNNEFHLCEFETATIQPELKNENIWWVSMGSGQPITDPFLGFVRKIFWENKQPDLKEGIYGAIWALQHVISLNTGGIGGDIQIATLTKQKGKLEAKLFTDQEIGEGIEYIKSFEEKIINCKTNFEPIEREIPKLSMEKLEEN